jgi:hypothetical protein
METRASTSGESSDLKKLIAPKPTLRYIAITPVGV